MQKIETDILWGIPLIRKMKKQGKKVNNLPFFLLTSAEQVSFTLSHQIFCHISLSSLLTVTEFFSMSQ